MGGYVLYGGYLLDVTPALLPTPVTTIPSLHYRCVSGVYRHPMDWCVLCRCRSLCYVGVCCVDVCVLCRFVLNHQ